MPALFDDATRAEVLASLLRSIEDAAPGLDIATMKDLKDLYDNTKGPLKYASMSLESARGRKEAWTPGAFTKLIVDKIAALLYGRTVERVTGMGEEIDARFDLIYKPSRGVFMRLSKMASLAGYAVIRIRRDWSGAYGFRLHGFDEVEPVLDPSNPSGLPLGVKFQLLLSELPRWVLKLNPKLKRERVYVFEELITRHERDENGDIVTPGVYEVLVEGKRVRNPYGGLNPLGDYLGCVWWRGLEHPFNAWGGSDILPVYNTLVRLNELLTDGTELLQWGLHSPVITNMQGKMQWKYAPRSIWKVEGTGTDGLFVKRLENGLSGLPGLLELINYMTQGIHRDTRIPSVATGDLNGIGKASSGRAFEIAMTPAKELVAEKENVCIPQEMELMEEMAARMIYYGDLRGKTYRYEGFDMPDPMALRMAMAKSSVSFTPLSFPQEVVAETLTGQVVSHIRSREDAIQELHPSWNETQVAEEIKLIDADTQASGDQSAEANIAALRARLAGQQ
jgi:hypothetical protein